MAATIHSRDLLRRLRPMTWRNTPSACGALTKVLYRLVVVLFAFQFPAANVMLRLDAGATQLGLSQATYDNWHKSIGLIARIVALLRLLARKRAQLPHAQCR
jgi:cytochrome b561